MANLPPALEEEEVKRLSLSQLKKEYIKKIREFPYFLIFALL